MTTQKTLLQQHFKVPADTLPADVVIRVQLSRTDYDKAVSRYMTINDLIERSQWSRQTRPTMDTARPANGVARNGSGVFVLWPRAEKSLNELCVENW